MGSGKLTEIFEVHCNVMRIRMTNTQVECMMFKEDKPGGGLTRRFHNDKIPAKYHVLKSNFGVQINCILKETYIHYVLKSYYGDGNSGYF